MKLKLLFLVCFYPLISYAQREHSIPTESRYPEDRRWLLNVAAGANIDLSGSSANPYSGLLRSRAEVAFMQKYRMTHLFSRKMGWYADVQLNLYSERSSGYISELYADDLFMAIFESLGEGMKDVFAFVHPSAGAGFVYRMEHGRWKIHPEIGAGCGLFLYGRSKSKTTTGQDGTEHGITYKQYEARSWYMNVGVSANYFITRRCFFVLNAGFRQPFRKSRAELIRTTNDVEVERLQYETGRVGRSLDLSLGWGITIGKRHRQAY